MGGRYSDDSAQAEYMQLLGELVKLQRNEAHQSGSRAERAAGRAKAKKAAITAAAKVAAGE